MPGQTGKKISQDYFNTIVNENINEFGMSQEEAIEDAVNQLKSQDADLTTICKYGPDEQQVLLDALRQFDEKIKNLVSESINKSESDQTENIKSILSLLATIRDKFNKNLSFRCLATRMEPGPNGYKILINYLKNLSHLKIYSTQILQEFFNTFESYINQQSDVLDTEGLNILIDLTSSNENVNGLGSDKEIIPVLLKCIRSACKMNEFNRQHFFDNGLCQNIIKLFQQYKENDAIVSETSQLIRSLLLDDDLRVEFGNSHEHAKFIASNLNGIDVLLEIGLKNEGNLNEETLAHLMLTLSKLAVRNEYCQEICDKGGLKFVLNCIEEKHLKNTSLLKSALSLLKNICNNDQVKYEATKLNAIFHLKQVLEKYSLNPQISDLTCAALSTLLLRNAESSEQVYQIELYKILVQILNLHYSKPKVIKNCCLALRNSISRNKTFGQKLIETGIEEILRKLLNQNDAQYFEETKALLRDLDLHVELKELWTGQGNKLSN